MSKQFSKLWQGLSLLALLFCVIIGFQNCSKITATSAEEKLASVGVSGNPPKNEDVICNPLDPRDLCDVGSGQGLLGNIYYLTWDQKSNYSGDLNNAKLADYIKDGYKLKQYVLMNQVNVPARNWEMGFNLSSGELIKDKDGNTLLEYFSIDLKGFISLPANEYQFALVSDDGMKLLINESEVLKDDGMHAPRWKCMSSGYQRFTQNEKKKIAVQYFQGPRNEIAMQLMYRPFSMNTGKCDSSGGWLPVPASAFSH